MKKILFVLVVFVLTMCSGFVYAYEAEAYKSMAFDGPGYYLAYGIFGGDKEISAINRPTQSTVDSGYHDAQISVPHTDFDHFSLGVIDSLVISDHILCYGLVEVLVNPLDYPRVPKNWYVPAYGDYFSAYINKTDNMYTLDRLRNSSKSGSHDWVITFKDDKGNIVAQDVLTGEMYDYFYERSFNEGNYFSSIELSVANAANPEWRYYYAIGLSDIKATAVPEPSSLLALAFGGAGTALAIRKRK